ncbi:MAG TPA: Uma2 family endonuclease [Pyrinomonadaceae bacterium]
MSTTVQTMTADELFVMPEDGFLYELVKGELRKMSPPGSEHGMLVARLTIALGSHVEAHDLGVTFGAETGFKLASNPDTVLAPDFAFISNERIPETGIPVAYWPGGPDLAVEVISPGNSRREMEEKIREYFAAGVRMVWMVYPKRRTVTVHRAGIEAVTLTETDALDGQDVVPGFRYSIAKLFAARNK